MSDVKSTQPKTTALHALHLELGAKMVDFAGYDMPVQYPLGVLKEHLHTRAKCGIFDVSHMGQAWLIGETQDAVCQAVETVLPAEIIGLPVGKQQYTQLLNEQGGTMDDLIITKPAEARYQDRLYTVVNAGCKDADYAHMADHMHGVTIERLETNAQLAIQGPTAVDVLSSVVPGVADLTFMSFKCFDWTADDGTPVELLISRSGYTGEDGYEVSIPNAHAVAFTRKLLSCDDAEMIGLGARDSLRLEAGLCLYGNDLDPTTTPIEGGLIWSIGKRRREQGGFIGASVIQDNIANGVTRKRVGLDIAGRVPCRAGTGVYVHGDKVGEITSGGFAPSVGKPVAMGYIATEYASVGTAVTLMVRGKEIPATVCKMPFLSHNYKR